MGTRRLVRFVKRCDTKHQVVQDVYKVFFWTFIFYGDIVPFDALDGTVGIPCTTRINRNHSWGPPQTGTNPAEKRMN